MIQALIQWIQKKSVFHLNNAANCTENSKRISGIVHIACQIN